MATPRTTTPGSLRPAWTETRSDRTPPVHGTRSTATRDCVDARHPIRSTRKHLQAAPGINYIPVRDGQHDGQTLTLATPALGPRIRVFLHCRHRWRHTPGLPPRCTRRLRAQPTGLEMTMSPPTARAGRRTGAEIAPRTRRVAQ